MKRLFHFLLAVLAVCCFLLCLYGINWIWTVKQPAIASATQAFDQGLDWLAIANKAMDDVNRNLELSRTQMLAVQTTLGGGAAGRPGPAQTMIARSVVHQMGPNISEVQHTVEKVTEASILINSILGSLQAVPTDAADKLDIDQVKALQQQVVSVTAASWDLGNILNDVDSADGDSPAAKSARIAASLSQILAVSQDFQQRMIALQKRIAQVRADTLYWMNITPTLATVGLSWVAFTQLIVIFVAIKAIQRRT